VNASREKTRLPGAVIALGLTSFFTDVGSEMIFPLLPVFVASLGASAPFIGLVEGAAEATASLLKLWSGRLADRSARKKPLVVVGYLLATLLRPLFAIATVPWHVLAVRVGDRVGKGVRTSPRDVLIASVVEDGQAGRAFGFHRAMDHAGAVLGPLLASALIAFGLSLRGVFWCALIPGLLSLAALATVREPPSTRHKPPPPGAARTRSGAALASYLGILALFSLGNSTDAFLLLRAKDLGVSVSHIPLLWAVLHVSKMASSYLGGDISDRIARHWVIVAGWVVYAATYLAFGVATASWQAWTAFVVYGAYYGLTEPAEKALVKDLSEPHTRGRAFGQYHAVVGLSAIPAGLLTGFLWQAHGARIALGVGAALAATSSLALAAWAVLSPQPRAK
jgi:MFS family permease